MRTNKATRGQVRRHNRQLLLRIIYSGLANNRAALALESGLAKPTVSALITEFLDEGLLIEGGRGASTESGGKRPRLLEFVPDARQVIGVSIKSDQIRAVLANLNGEPYAEHFTELNGRQGRAVITLLQEVINGLIAQLDAPLLCIGVGISGHINSEQGIVDRAAHLGWEDLRLGELLTQKYRTPVYVANSTEMAALGQYMFATPDAVNSLVMVLVNNSVGIGTVLDGARHHFGSEISHLVVPYVTSDEHTLPQSIQQRLGWQAVRESIAEQCQVYPDSMLAREPVTYLLIRYAAANGDPVALALHEELSETLALVLAWIATLLHPQHILVAGRIAELGESLLIQALDRMELLIAPELFATTTFSLANASNLVAMGAVAYTLQQELGLV
ncbi:ROK family protein [Chloroflexota bacterium]